MRLETPAGLESASGPRELLHPKPMHHLASHAIPARQAAQRVKDHSYPTLATAAWDDAERHAEVARQWSDVLVEPIIRDTSLPIRLHHSLLRFDPFRPGSIVHAQGLGQCRVLRYAGNPSLVEVETIWTIPMRALRDVIHLTTWDRHHA